MAYEPTIWKDRIIEKPKTYTIQNNPDGTVTLVPVPGVVTEEGTPVNANNLNKLEQGLKSHEADNAKQPNDPTHHVKKDGTMQLGLNSEMVGGMKVVNMASFTKIAESAINASITYDVAGDDTYIYVAEKNVIKKYLKEDLSLIATSPVYNTNSTIYAIVVDNTHVYVGGGQVKQTIRKYLKADLSYIGESAPYQTTSNEIRALAVDDTYIYAGGFNSPHTVNKYLKSDLSLVAQSNSLGDSINSIVVDDKYIYVTGDYGKYVRRYLKSSMVLDGTTSTFETAFSSLIIDGDYIYAGGKKIVRYRKSDLSYVDETIQVGTTIGALAVDDVYIYAGGSGLGSVIKRYLKSDLSYVDENKEYSYRIYGIVIDGGHSFITGISGEPIRKLALYFNLGFSHGGGK